MHEDNCSSYSALMTTNNRPMDFCFQRILLCMMTMVRHIPSDLSLFLYVLKTSALLKKKLGGIFREYMKVCSLI